MKHIEEFKVEDLEQRLEMANWGEPDVGYPAVDPDPGTVTIYF